jgi:hypothetical protein
MDKCLSNFYDRFDIFQIAHLIESLSDLSAPDGLCIQKRVGQFKTGDSRKPVQTAGLQYDLQSHKIPGDISVCHHCMLPDDGASGMGQLIPVRRIADSY